MVFSLRESELIVSFSKKPDALAFMDEVYSKLVFKRESMF
jgi:aspartate/methionine/tyrosine aminotransferase